jgi:radical SAM/Cys-rich protein
MHATLPHLDQHHFPALRRRGVSTVQVNIGYYCNQACLHCHVNAGPTRKERMAHETARQVVAFLDANPDVRTLDITGGAPELHNEFRYLVREARARDIHVMDRCNLTVLELPEQEGLAEFLAEHRVEIVASLPCYSSNNVDQQRGKGVFASSIQGLQRLNALGYGRDDALPLHLVYNPLGPFLPPDQVQLEEDYRSALRRDFGIEFTSLYCLANLPIHRFGSTLISRGQFEEYMELLKSAHQEANLDSVMCRDLVSIDWRGYVYDCDFNQMLDLPVGGRGQAPRHISELTTAALAGEPIAVSGHCYGCTAGQGSSCGGALAPAEETVVEFAFEARKAG